jgi:hypothetical protein
MVTYNLVHRMIQQKEDVLMANTSEQKHNCMECPPSKPVEILRLSKQQKFNQEKSLGDNLISFSRILRQRYIDDWPLTTI